MRAGRPNGRISQPSRCPTVRPTTPVPALHETVFVLGHLSLKPYHQLNTTNFGFKCGRLFVSSDGQPQPPCFTRLTWAILGVFISSTWQAFELQNRLTASLTWPFNYFLGPFRTRPSELPLITISLTNRSHDVSPEIDVVAQVGSIA